MRMSNRHLLIISVFRYPWHSCTSLNSNSAPLFESLCLNDSLVKLIHPCFSRQKTLKNRSDSLSELILMWFCRLSMRSEQRVSRTNSNVSGTSISADNAASSALSPQRCTDNNSCRQKCRSFFVSDELLGQSYFRQSITTCQRLPNKSFIHSQSITQCLSCPTFASQNSTLGNV